MYKGYRRKDLLIVLLSIFFFGASFPVLKYVLLYIPPFLFATIRAIFTISFFIFLFLFLKKKIHFPRGSSLKSSLYLAMFSTFIPSLSQNYGMILLKSSSAATVSSVLQSTSPIFTTILAFFYLNERLTLKKSLGASISFGGILLLSVEEAGYHILSNTVTLGGLLILLSALSYSEAGIVIKRAFKHISILDLLLWSSIFSALFLFPGSLLLIYMGVEYVPLAILSPYVISSILFLSYVIGGFILIGWYYLLFNYPLSRLSFFSYLIPFFSGIISYIFLGERMGITTIIFAIIIIFGVYLVQSPEKKKG